MPANAGSTMLPLYSLLNPALPAVPICSSLQPKSSTSFMPASIVKPKPSVSSVRVTMDAILQQRGKAQTGVDNPTKSRPHGPVNFAPFEDVDQASVQELTRFRVSPLGQIHQCCEHIPYNSAKKDFFEKTGRESMEVFKYQFQLPGDDNRFTIMWDYNVGLVRMTPFFKCLGFPKTKPSQMLDKNPGLREITPSVTGGAVSAQGYWMPYRCARAVCATFCYCIAGALIPIFGPDFPSQCTPPESSYYKEMTISQQVIIDTTQEAEYYRRVCRERLQQIPRHTIGHGQLEVRRKPTQVTDQSSAQHCRPRPSREVLADVVPCGEQSQKGQFLVSGPRVSRVPQVIRRISPLMRRPSPARAIVQRHDPSLTRGSAAGPAAASQSSALAGAWRPKRRRRGAHDSYSLHNRGKTVAPDTDLRSVVRRPGQESDRIRAAAALVSLHQDNLQQQQKLAGSWSAAIGELSDDGSSGGSSGGSSMLRERKRPKAHSF